MKTESKEIDFGAELIGSLYIWLSHVQKSEEGKGTEEMTSGSPVARAYT